MPQQHSQQQRQPPQFLRDDDDPRDGGHHQPYPDHDPYQTPKFGQHAKPTTPMAHKAPLRPGTMFPTKEVCWDCEGRGVLNSQVTQCPVCRIWWSREQIKARAHRTVFGLILPCDHQVRTSKLTFQREPCPTCRASQAGPGYLPGWRPLADLLDLFQQYFGIPDETSAEMRALFQQSEPTAPPPHLAVNTPVYIHAADLLDHVSAGPAATQGIGANHMPPLMPDEWEQEQIRQGRNKSF